MIDHSNDDDSLTSLASRWRTKSQWLTIIVAQYVKISPLV